jgi:hypothetical protein
MSSSGFSPSLVIDHHRCRRVQALIGCSTVLALAALGYGGLPPWPHGLGVLLVVAGGLRELKRASPHAPGHVSQIVVTGDGGFLLGLAGAPGSLVPAAVSSSWRLPGVAVGLAFVVDQTDRAGVILFRDRLSPDAWRRLAVSVRHARCTPP